jgi:hypothetical protein
MKKPSEIFDTQLNEIEHYRKFPAMRPVLTPIKQEYSFKFR